MVLSMEKENFDKYCTEQANAQAIAQLSIGQLVCNSLTVNHYFQIGNYVVSCDLLKNVKGDQTVFVLEAMK